MGGGIGKARNNDELVDNLVDAMYIRTPIIESAFRSVDRGDYISEDAHSRLVAYKDVAWRSGCIHLSASCIYSEVMESLLLRPGLSFLNIGSGTGYLSTIVGLILGPSGVNHGIEEKQAAVKFAEKRLEKFSKKRLPKLVHFNFCRPQFIVGNIFLWKPTILYDRIYCGAECPRDGLKFIKLCLKINGILIIPIANRLVKIVRTSLTEYTHQNITSVSFASLVKPSHNELLLERLSASPPTLMQLCISDIRNKLQRTIFESNPEFKSMHRTLVKAEELLAKDENKDNSDDSNNKTNKRHPPFDFYNPESFKKLRSTLTKENTSPITYHNEQPHATNVVDTESEGDPVEMREISAFQHNFLERVLTEQPSNLMGEGRPGANRRYRRGHRSIVGRFRRAVEAYEHVQPSTSRGSGRPLMGRLEMVNLPTSFRRDREFLEYQLEIEDSDTELVNNHVEACRTNRQRSTLPPFFIPTRLIDPFAHAASPPRLPDLDRLLHRHHTERAPVQESSAEESSSPPESESENAPVPPDPTSFASLSSSDSDSLSDNDILINEHESTDSDSQYSDFEMDTDENKKKEEKIPTTNFSEFLNLYQSCLNNELTNLGLPYMLKNLIGYTKKGTEDTMKIQDTEDIKKIQDTEDN